MDSTQITKYINAVRHSIIRPRYRVSLLYSNDDIYQIINGDLIKGSSSLTINYQQGTRRSCNIVLDNSSEKWTPNENSKLLWFGSKLKLELGVELDDGEIIWNPAGIFVIGDPVVNKQNRTVSLQCYDKFALFNGTAGGTLDGTYEIPANTKIINAIKDILYADNGNGQPVDSKPLIFDSAHLNATTPYTISHSSDSNFGAILVELANMIACDIFYDEDGHLVVENGISDISHIKKATLWDYKEGDLEYSNPESTYKLTSVRNRVIVTGTNPATDTMVTGIAENRNRSSSICIQKIGIKNYYISDDNISTQELAQARAEYELSKLTQIGLTITMQSTFMIHLDVNKCIGVTDKLYNFNQSKFVIQSINIPLQNGTKIDIQCTNIVELPYYPGIS